jgi:pilus assembly protein CpaC
MPADSADPVAFIDVAMRTGESRLIRGLHSSRVVVGTDKIVTAVVLENREVMLFGNAQGATTVQVWDTANVMRTFQITVSGLDIAKMAEEVKLILGDIPNIRVNVVGDKVVVDGRNVGDENLFRIALLTKRLENVVNLTEYQKDNGGWDQMVMLDVKVVEFKNRDRVRDLGINWDLQNVSGPIFGIAGDIKSSTTRTGQQIFVQPGSTNGIAGSAVTIADQGVNTIAPFRTYFGMASALFSKIRLLANDGEAVILSEPQLTARHGKAARMNVGGRIPLQVTSGIGATEVRYERYGVILEVTPFISRSGTVQAKIKAEVSEPGQTYNNLVSFNERMVETVFNVQDGETMVLSGMVQRQKTSATAKVPGIGDLPFVGHAFKNTIDVERDTEVIIFVTARIVSSGHPGVQNAIDATERRIDDTLGVRPGQELIKP